MLFSNVGSFIAKTDRQRDTTGADNYVGLCGKPLVMNLDADSQMELLIPGLDGHIHQLDWVSGSPSKLVVSTYRREYFNNNFPGNGCEVSGKSILTWDDDGDTSNGFYAVVGGNGETDLGSGPVVTNLVQVKLNPSTLLMTNMIWDTTLLPQQPEVAHLEWKDSPGNGATLFVGYGKNIKAITVSPTGFGVPPSAPQKVVPGIYPDASAAETPLPVYRDEMCGLVADGSYLYVPTPNGRIFILDKTTLAFTRNSDDVIPSADFGADTPTEWPANRTLAYAFGATTHTDPSVSQDVWVDDEVVRYKTAATGDSEHFRCVGLDPYAGSLDPWFRDFDNPETFGGNGRLRYRDLNHFKSADLPQKTYLYYRTYEDGDAFDFDLTPGGVDIRRYTSFATQSGGSQVIGGYVFLDNDFSQLDTWLTSFEVPTGSGLTKYKWIGSSKYAGQISTQNSLSEYDLYRGVSLKIGMLPDVSGTVKPLIVTGTIGGFVYVIDPNAAPGSGLVRFTDDLGWLVVGMDIGDLDDETAHNEIVVGTFLDTGSYVDYKDSSKARTHNRGHVYILNPEGGVQQLVPTTITLDNDPVSPDPFSAGVFGVKIDDINADGRNELWVGDGAGYLYALYRNSSNQWKCFFRTRGLGCYAGVRNKIFPYKIDHKTEYLTVMTAGYVYRFDVNPAMVPSN